MRADDAGLPAWGSAALGYARGTALIGFVDLAEHLGLDAMALARASGVPDTAFADTDAKVRIEAALQLFTRAAAQSGCADFGLRLASRRQLSDWGPLALVMREQPDLEHVLEAVSKYVGLLNDGARLSVLGAGSYREWRFAFSGDAPPSSTRQVIEFTLGVMARNLRELMGAGFQPLAVCFRHRRLAQLETHHRVFRCELLFDQAFDGLVIAAQDLRRTVPGANPAMARHLETYIRGLIPAGPQSLSDQVVDVARRLLPGGGCSRESVAEALGLGVRTLQRRLSEEGVTFARLLDQVRDRLARDYIEGSRRPLAEVAGDLGFASQSAFNHWHQVRHGQRPTARRRASQEAVQTSIAKV